MNKKVLLIIFLAFFSCKIDEGDTKISFPNQVYLGEMSIKDTIFKEIEITNLGNNSLKIDSIGVSCGCTVVDYNKSPIMTNQRSTIKISFRPEQKGIINKIIMIDANTDPPFNIITLKGEVK